MLQNQKKFEKQKLRNYCICVNANNFEIALFLFLLLFGISARTGKSFLLLFHESLSATGVASTGLISLDTLANIFVRVILIFVLDVSVMYLFNMCVEFETYLKTV